MKEKGRGIENRERRIRISKIILSTVATAGLIGFALLAPNAVQALRLIDGKGTRKGYEDRVQTSLSRLINDGSLRVTEKDGKKFFELTKKGERKLGDLYKYHSLLQKPKRWDGKWRIVSFDIYEKRREARDKLRATLRGVGFTQLHKSMWVSPYDCEDLVTLLKSDLKMGRNLLYIVADRIEGDKKLREHYKL